MGGLCSCLSPDVEQRQEPSPRTPLLDGTEPTTQEVSNIKSVRKQQTAGIKHISTSVEALVPVSCGKIALPLLDKTFQDHSKLYNDLLKNFNLLRQTIVDLKILTVEENNVHASLETCIKNIVSMCGGLFCCSTDDR
ncbi:uncharacterized protein LOC121368231 isoform X2 [Gigantopelta aegis]|uniref:uncharacterized protein LOC121368231 isoform X2 n=1 Tax=Gigantopelta aegis TaxID=1735272 RepID=UPI001B887E2B|nr:uncharacterized protein LOC121368231 isoform X2 [Gigantopelta aegis]